MLRNSHLIRVDYDQDTQHNSAYEKQSNKNLPKHEHPQNQEMK
jgi:hypothetical protein